MTQTVDAPIKAMIDATNRGDREAFLNAFADNATLTDFGRTFPDKAQIARWNGPDPPVCASPASRVAVLQT